MAVIGEKMRRRRSESMIFVLFSVLFYVDLRAEAAKTEIYDAPAVRVELVDGQVAGFYVSKTRDLRLRCSIVVPSSVRLSENTKQIVWRYNEEEVGKAGLPAGSFKVVGDELTLKANEDAELLVGKYACNVTWPTYGSVLSSPVQVQLAAFKKFKSDPPNEERVVVGHTAYLPCHAPESHPGPAKIWFVFNGTKEIIFSNDRHFLTSNGLQIGRVEKSDRGSYLCRAMNPLSGQSRDSKPIDLIILDDDKSISPSIVDEPRPSPYLQQRNTLDVRRGDNVTLECVMVNGNGRTTSAIKWEKYGSRLPDPERRKHVWANMVLYNVTKEDEGTYICRGGANDSISDKRQPSLTSQAKFIMYSLRVHDPLKPKLTIELDTEEYDKSATSGVAYRLTCRASSGLASELEFWVNGRPLLSQPLNPVSTKFQSGESPKWSFTLTESTLRKGVYQCMVRGRKPFDEFVIDSDNLYVDSLFSASSSSDPKIKSGLENNDDWSSRSSASGMDEPNRATQSMDAESSIVSSWRRNPPGIKVGPENETTTVGSSVTFVCQVSSNTEAVYWLKDGRRIVDYDPNDDEDDDEEIADDRTSRRYKRIGTGSLNIETTTDQDRGWYTCVAVNSNGNATAKAYLDFERQTMVVDDDDQKPNKPAPGTVAAPRAPSTNSLEDEDENDQDNSRDRGTGKNGKKKKIKLEAPSVYRYSNTSVHLRWRAMGEQRRGNGGVRFFKLQYRKLIKGEGEKEKDLSWKTLDQELPSHSHSGTIDGLEPGQKYKFRYAVVYDNNEQAVSKMTPSYEMTVEKKQVGPKLAPTLTSVKAISWSAISLYWNYPTQEQAQPDGFVIIYRRIYYADTSMAYQNETVIGGWTREHVLSHLLPATPYQIKMVAFNTAGRSRESSVVEESTLSTDGTKPPRTFDAASQPDRSSGVVSRNNPTFRAIGGGDGYGSLDVTATGVDVSSWPPVSANRTDRNTGVLAWLNIKSETLLYIIGGVLGALFILLIIFMVVCTVKQRKQKKLVSAAQGKYRDTSKKIYREQSLCNERSVMKEMYPPISNSVSFQHSNGDSDNDDDQCPPPPAPSQSTLGLVRSAQNIPPPPSMTGYSNGGLRNGAGIIMNLYANPLDYDDGEEDRKLERRMGLLNRTTTEFVDGEEGDELLSAEDRLLTDNYSPDCDLNKNDVRYGIRGLGASLSTSASINGRHHRPIPPPLILTSASALTSAGPFGNNLNHSFLSSSSPHPSVTSNYSSTNTAAVDVGQSSLAPPMTNGLYGNNHTPLLPPPLFVQQLLNDDSSEVEAEKRKRIPTPVPTFQHSQQKPSSSLARRQARLDDTGGIGSSSIRGQTNPNLLNGGGGGASPMSVSSHASIGSGSATSQNGGGGGSRPNFSTFRPESTRQQQDRHNRNHLLLYRNRLSDGYCSDA